jgi:hypothetical protein
MAKVIAEQRIAAGPTPATATITFTDIPNRPHLGLRYKVKSTDTGAVTALCGVRIGNDSGTDYSYQTAFAAATTPAAAESLGATFMLLGNIPSSHASVPTKSFGVGTMEFPFANETDMDKVSLVPAAAFRSTALSGGLAVYQNGGWYHDATLGDDVIARIDVLLGAGNFAAGTVIQLVED